MMRIATYLRYIFFINAALLSVVATGQNKTLVKKTTGISHKKSIPDYCYLNCRVIETPAEFPSCDTGWERYLAGMIDANLPKRKGAPPGVYFAEVYFVILKDGSIEAITPVSRVGFGMEETLCNAIRQSPKWRPATHNGRKMSYRRRQFFRFVVTEPQIT